VKRGDLPHIDLAADDVHATYEAHVGPRRAGSVLGVGTLSSGDNLFEKGWLEANRSRLW